MSRIKHWFVFAVVGALAPGCGRSHEAPKNEQGRTETAVATGYPRATWRVTSFAELNRTFLWVSHIVVAHDGSNPNGTKLRGLQWSPDAEPISRRTRPEALRLAREVQELAQADPSSFPTLARTYSDDVVTKDSGGSLGGSAAGQLPPEFLDALAVLRPGEVSRIVETSFGFHVLKRNSMPAPSQVAGTRIVVGYHNRNRRGAVQSDRSRDEARVRAGHVVEVARSGGRTFESLVSEFSDDDDKIQGGDIGVYSVQDPDFLPREVERLASLQEGEISEPMDGAVGFTILRRVPVFSRSTYAMRAVRFTFDPTVPEGRTRSRSAAAREATLFARAIKESPDQFEKILREQCCEDVISFTEGRGPVGIAPVLGSLKLGEITPGPVISPTYTAYIIAQRVDPRSAPAELAARYELSSPPAPDVETLVRTTDRSSLARSARLLRDQLPLRLAFTAAHRRAFEEVTSRLAVEFETQPDEESTKVELWRATNAEIKGFLSAPEFSKFENTLNGWVIERLMENAP